MSGILTLKVTTPGSGFRYVSDAVLVKEVQRIFDAGTAQEVLQTVDEHLLGSSGPQFGTYVQDLMSIFTKLDIAVEFIDENGTSITISAKNSGI